MSMILKLQKALAANVNTNPQDVFAAKAFLQDQGHYAAPEWGLSEFPDRALFDAIKAFQKSNGLRVDGVMNPEGETEQTTQRIQANALNLQNMGRNGDIILAHITPAEAKMLKEKGGSGTVNPKTGLLEFYDAGKNNNGDKKKGKYIWRTAGDSKVRSSHADRDGKTFSWDNSPAGGHPGEAPNCRCEAEDVNSDFCAAAPELIKKARKTIEKLQAEYDQADQEIKDLPARIEEAKDEFRMSIASAIASIGKDIASIPWGGLGSAIMAAINAGILTHGAMEDYTRINEMSNEIKLWETKRKTVSKLLKDENEHLAGLLKTQKEKCASV